MDEAVSLALEAELRSATWGARPGLYAIVLQGSQCRLLPVPRRDWALPPAAEALVITAGALSGVIAPAPGLHGTALRFRAGPRFAWTDLEMYAAAGRQAGRPPSRARYLIAVTRDGTTYQARWSPGEDQPATLSIPPGRPLPYNQVLQALRHATAAGGRPTAHPPPADGLAAGPRDSGEQQGNPAPDRGSDEELLAGVLLARIQRSLEQEGALHVPGLGDVTLDGEPDREPGAGPLRLRRPADGQLWHARITVGAGEPEPGS